MITITKQDNGVLFEFEDSKKYLYGNGSILLPFNTLSIIADESNMITLRKAASNDIFLSARYDTDLGYGSKDDAIDDLKDLLFAETGGGSESGITPSEVQEMIDESISGKADTTYVNQIASQATDAITALTQTVSNNYDELTGQTSNLDLGKFGAVKYNSNTHTISFYAHNDTEVPLGSIDASAFIKDGMVSNVEISNGNLVITFNSDAGKQPISIPLTSIFDPANYYTTAQTQSYVEGYTYDKATIDQKVAEGGTFDPDLYYDKTATDALLAAKADAATTYTKTEVDTALGNKADTSAVTAVANDVQTVSGQVQTKVATSDFNAYSAATATAIGNKQNALVFYSENEYDEEMGEEATAQIYVLGQGDSSGNGAVVNVQPYTVALSASSEGEDPMSTTLVVTSDGVTINEEGVLTEGNVDNALNRDSTNPVANSAITNAINAKQDALSAGTGIEISGNVISATGGGGATYTAGTNISIDTANTINCTLNLANGSATGQGSIVIAPYNTTASGNRALAGGMSSSAGGEESIAYGSHAKTDASSSFALGSYVETKNKYETSLGQYNKTIKTSSWTFGHSGNTLFSVGNGTSDSARHNAFEIRQNGDIYVNDGTNDVRLQDTILALGGLKLVSLTQSEYDNLATKSNDTLYIINNVVS